MTDEEKTKAIDDKLAAVLADLRDTFPTKGASVMVVEGPHVNAVEWCSARDMASMAIAFITALGERWQQETGTEGAPVELGLGIVIAMSRPQAQQLELEPAVH